MRSKLLSDDGTRTFALVFDTDEEAAEALRRFASRERLDGARITGVGGFVRASLGFFDWDLKEYAEIPVDEQVEVLSFDGDIASKDGEPEVHVHVVAGRRDGTTVGGHLLEGYVRPTLEVIVSETPAHLRRTHDPESGLALIDLS